MFWSVELVADKTNL